MGNHHSDQEQQNKGNPEAKPESSPKPKKENDLWSNFRNRTKASGATSTQTSPFKPVPPNLFKGVPDFTSTAATPPVCITESPVRLIPPEESPLNPTVPEFEPKGCPIPIQHWGPKEPSAYNISWERPRINSPMPSPIPSFPVPPVPGNTHQRHFQKAVPPTTSATPASPTVTSPSRKLSVPRPKTPPIVPKNTWPKPLLPVKSVMPQEPILPQPPSAQQKPTTKVTIEEISTEPPQPLSCVDKSLQEIQGPQPSSKPTEDPKPASTDNSAKATSNHEGNTAAQDEENKESDKVKKQTFVISEETHAEIMSRLAYVEKKKLEDAQTMAVMRKALNGVSYAEAVKKSQPKVNPARREAKAKSSKKAKKSAKQAQTQTAANTADGGSGVPQQPANNSPTSHLPLKETLEPAVSTQKINVKADPQQMASHHQNEQPAVSPVNMEREERRLTNVNFAISKIGPEDNNQTQNPSPASSKSPSVAVKIPFPSCEVGNTLSSQSVVMTSEVPDADLKNTSSASSHQSNVGQAPQSSPKLHPNVEEVSCCLQTKTRDSEQESRIDDEKGEESVKCSPLQDNSHPGPSEDSVAMDTSADLSDCSEVTTVPCALSKEAVPPGENQKSPCTTHPQCTSLSLTGPAATLLRHMYTCKRAPCLTCARALAFQRTLVCEHHPRPVPAPTSKRKQRKPPKNQAPEPSDAESNNDEPSNLEEVVPVQPSPPPLPSSPPPPPHPEGRWHPFTTDRTCVQKVRCQHRQNGSLPKNVMQWQNVSRNHLCEPPWATTASLAASIALTGSRLEREDSRQ